MPEREPYYVAGVRGDTVENKLLDWRSRPGARGGLPGLLYRFAGQGPEGHRSPDPVTDWAEQRVGQDGYALVDSAPDVRGRRQDMLPGFLRGVGAPKCNQFVFDALAAGGRPSGRMDGGRIPVAEDWGDPRSPIAGYHPVRDAPRPGDVISNGHHVGIYSPLPDGKPGTVSAAALKSPDSGVDGQVVHNDWGFRGDEGPLTVWRSLPR